MEQKEISMKSEEAIPVVWIENYAAELIEKEKSNRFAYRGCAETGEAILSMIRTWKDRNDIWH